MDPGFLHYILFGQQNVFCIYPLNSRYYHY